MEHIVYRNREFVTVADAAASLGVSERRVQQFCKSGRLEHERLSGLILVDLAALRQFERLPKGWQLGRKRKIAS